MIDELDIKQLFTDFILSYLATVRQLASRIPESDRGHFLDYWFYPIRIRFLIGLGNDVAIIFRLRVSGRKDRITVKEVYERIEKYPLPHLDYNNWPVFQPQKNCRNSVISHLTVDLGTHPLIILSRGCEIRFIDVRLKSNVQGYPRYYKQLWFFTTPYSNFVTEETAELRGYEDFWSYIYWYFRLKYYDIKEFMFEDKTLELFIDALKRLKEEYINLITRKDIIEQHLQLFIQNHYFLLSPDELVTKEIRVIGDYKPDFILKKKNDDIILVELEGNEDPLCMEKDISSELKEGINQILSWFKWIEENEPQELSKYSSIIVIGRKDEYEKAERIINDALRSCSIPITLKTYDDLALVIDEDIKNLEKKVLEKE